MCPRDQSVVIPHAAWAGDSNSSSKSRSTCPTARYVLPIQHMLDEGLVSVCTTDGDEPRLLEEQSARPIALNCSKA